MTITVNPIIEEQTVVNQVEVGKTYTVTLSEREAGLLKYLLGRAGASFGLAHLYRQLRDADKAIGAVPLGREGYAVSLPDYVSEYTDKLSNRKE